MALEMQLHRAVSMRIGKHDATAAVEVEYWESWKISYRSYSLLDTDVRRRGEHRYKVPRPRGLSAQELTDLFFAFVRSTLWLCLVNTVK